MGVSPKGWSGVKLSLDAFPDVYRPGKRNCFDCRHFRLTLAVSGGEIQWEGAMASCRRKNLLRDSYNDRVRGVAEYTTRFNAYQWKLIKRGWRDEVWSFANVCDDFESMGNHGRPPAKQQASA